MNNLEKYNDAFIKALGIDENMLDSSLTFKDTVQWDSVSHLSLVSILEDTFNIMFDSYDILHYESYENGKKILRKMGINIEEIEI